MCPSPGLPLPAHAASPAIAGQPCPWGQPHRREPGKQVVWERAASLEEGPWAPVVLPVGSCWLQGQVHGGGGPWSHCEVMGEWGCGQPVGSWLPSPGGRRCCCYFFMAQYLGAILRFPQSRHAEPSVPKAPASRAEAGSLQKPFQSPASELAAVFPAGPDVRWSPGAGEPPRRGRSLGLGARCCPLWLPGKAGPGLELVLWAPGPPQPVGTGLPFEHWNSTLRAHLTGPAAL